MSTAAGTHDRTPDRSPREEADRPHAIDAKPVRHPWRWVALFVIGVLIAMMISSFVTNPRWGWPMALKIMNFNPVLNGLIKGTIIGTIGAMVLGVVIGVIVGIMRLSGNPILRGVGFVYTWFFRGIPRLVLVTMLGSAGYLYPKLDIGPLPFSQQLAHLLGLSSDFTLFSLNVNEFSSTLMMGIIGLGISEAAYMAEIARGGILSVDPGQREAAQALGMNEGKIMRRIVLPQAMRVIIPPTGNETIAMLKDTSLLSALPLSSELFFQTQQVGTRTLQIMPSFVAATVWYLIITTVLMIAQYYLERHFGRGFGAQPGKKKSKAESLLSAGSQH